MMISFIFTGVLPLACGMKRMKIPTKKKCHSNPIAALPLHRQEGRSGLNEDIFHENRIGVSSLLP
jgi:hypothetical protein